MGYYTTTRRKSSFHWAAEAYLAFGIGLARRVSHSERRYSYSERRSSHAERRTSKSKSKSKSFNTSTSSQHKAKRISISPPSSTHQYKKNHAKSYPCYHRIVNPNPDPEPSPYPQHRYETHSFHDFCVASDATYASLASRLKRLRGHEEDVAAYVRERGDRSGLGTVAEGLGEDIERWRGFWRG